MLVFLVGLFALSGLFAADAKIVATEGGVSSSWSSASWVDSNGTSVQAPTAENTAVLNTVKGSINLKVTEDLSISTLIIYGEKPCTINIADGKRFSVSTLVLGSGGRSASISLIPESDNNILGQIQVEGNGILDIAYMDTTSYCGQNSGTLKNPKLTIKENASVNITGTWNLGEYGSAVELENNGNLFVTGNRTGKSDLVTALSTTLGDKVTEPIYVWKDSTTNVNWNVSSNWTDKEGNAVTTYPSKTGDIAVFKSSVSFPQMQDAGIAEGATIVLRVEEGYEVSFGDYFSAFNNRNFIVEKGNVSFGSTNESYGSITIGSNAKVEIKQVKVKSITNQGELTVTGQLQEVKENLINEGKITASSSIKVTGNFENKTSAEITIGGDTTVSGDIINEGIINLSDKKLNINKNYSGNGAIQSRGGTFQVSQENGDSTSYEPTEINKLVLEEGSQGYSIYLSTVNTNREIHVLENIDNDFSKTIKVDKVTLPKGTYADIIMGNFDLSFSGDATVNGTITSSNRNIYVGNNIFAFKKISSNQIIYVKDGSTIEYLGEEDFTLNSLVNDNDNNSITIKSSNEHVFIIRGISGKFKQIVLGGMVSLGSNWAEIRAEKFIINQKSTVTIPDTVKLYVTDELENNGTLKFDGTSSGVEYVVSNFTNKGTVTQNGTLTINGNFASGNSSSTYASVTLAPTSDDPVTVSGFGAINSLNAQNVGGKTINFDDNITITGQNSNLKGSGNENKLNIGGEGAITVTNENAISTQYLNFLSSSSPIVKENYIKVNNSSAPNRIFPAGWIDDRTYIWTGAVSDYLPEEGNWEERSVPLDGDDNVSIIVTKPTELSYPFVMQTSDNKQNMINFIIEENAEAQIPAGAFVEVTGGCTNNGTIINNGELTFNEILSSSGTIINNGKVFIEGTAEISGTYLGTNDSLYIINQDEERKTVTINSPITIGTLFIAGNVDLELNGAVSVKNFLTNAGDTNFIAHDFTVNIDGSGSLSATSMDFTRASSTDGVIGTYELNVPVTCSREIKTHSGSVLNIKSNTQTNTLVHSANNANYQTFINVKSNASLTVNETIDLAANANSGASLSVESGATVKAKSIIDTSTFANGEGQIPLTNYGTIEVSESIDLTTISNFGTITTPTINTSSITNSGAISATTKFTATEYLRPTDSTSDVVNIKEGTTLLIENGTISTLNVEKTDDDFATISSTGTLTISSATYNNADIQTNGKITLANTGDSDTIGNLTIETGELTIENLNVENLTNKANFSSSTVNITGNLTDSGTSFAGTINFVGNGEQTFTPNATTVYGDINIGDGTSASSTSFAGSLSSGIISIRENSTLKTNGISITAETFNIPQTNAVLELSNATISTLKDSTYRGIRGSGFTISAAEEKIITIDQDTVETEGNQNYFASVKLTNETTFKSGGTIIFGKVKTDAFVQNDDVAPKLILQAPTVIYGNSTIDSITTSDSLSLESDNTINNLSVTNAGGKTLTIDGQITVTTMELSGTNTDNLLQIDGSGKFSFTAEPSGNVGTYLKFIKKESPMVVIPDKPNGMDILENSFDHNGETTEFPSGWQEIIGINTRTWEGDVDTDWDNPENWEEESNPNQESNVYIPVVQEGSSYPITNEEINVKSLNIATDAKITLNNLLTATDGITNEGTITLTNDYTVTCTILNKGQIDATKSLIIQNGAQVINNKKIIIYENLVVKNDAELINQKLDNSYTGITVYDNVTIAGNYSGDGLFNLSDKANPHTITIDTQTTISSLGIVGTQIDFVCNSPLTVGTLTKAEGLIYLQNGELSIGNYSQDSSISDTENILKLNEGSSISFTNPVEFHTVEIINKDDSSVANINATDFTTETLNVYGDFTNANSNAINATTMTVDMNQQDADSDVVIGGNFSVGTFNCKEQGGKSLEVKGVINMNEMFISGTKNAETNYLTLQGIGSFAYNDSDKTQFVGSYLKFTSDAPTVSQGHAEIRSSKDKNNAESDFPKGWIFPSERTWKGGEGIFALISEPSKWGKDNNWEEGAAPNATSKVIIPRGKDYYPSFADGQYSIEILSLNIENGASIVAAKKSNVHVIKIEESFENAGTIDNTGATDTNYAGPFALWIGGDLKNTGTIKSNCSSITITQDIINKNSSNNFLQNFLGQEISGIEVHGNVYLNGGSIEGTNTFAVVNRNSKDNHDFEVSNTQSLNNLLIKQGGFDFNIQDSSSLKVTGTLTNNGMIHLQKGILNAVTYSGSGDIYLYKGSNLKITNYSGTGKIYLEEGATLSIEKATENPTLEIKKTSADEDFATISTSGTLTISTTYNNADIQTNGNITLPDTTKDNKIGSLLIESGELKIDNLHATSLNVVEGTFINEAMNVDSVTNAGTITSSTVNVAGDLENNGNINATTSIEANNVTNEGEITTKDITVTENITNSGEVSCNTILVNGDLENNGTITVTTSVQANDISNSGAMNVATTNVSRNLTDSGTWSENGIINFNGSETQEFTPNSSSTYANILVEKTGGILTIKDVLNVTKLQIKSNVIFEKPARIGDLSIDMSSSENENFVKFAGASLYKIATLEFAKGKQTQKLTLGSTNEEKWNVYFENIPAKEVFSYVIISSSKSVKEDGTTLNELEYIATDENLVPFEKTTEGWFNFNKFYWIGKTSSSWHELSNWAATLAGTGTITECPPFDNSSLELYITNNSQNPLLIENELVANLLNIPAEKSVEMNSRVTVQTVQNMGEMIFANEISVQELNNNGSIFVNSGILTIENYVPNSDKINIKEGGTLKITKEDETTIPNLTFIKTDSSTEDFAILEGNLSVKNATYNSADIQISGKINLRDSTEENSIGNLEIESGELTTETLYAANLTNDGTLSTKTVTVTNNITNAGEITSDIVLATGDLTNNGNLNATTSVQANNIVNTGEITSDTVLANNDLENNGTLNATTSVEATNITNSGEITTLTVKANAELTNAENATITATNGSVTVGTNLTNAGEITSDTVLVTGDLTNSGSMNVATTNVGGNLIDNGTWQQTDSTEINFNGTDAQEFTPNPNSTYALINVENSGGILTINKVLNVTNLQINSNVIFEDTATIENLSIDMSSSEDENFVKFAGEKTYTITTLVGAKGNSNSKLKLASTNDKLWNVYFENKPEIESFEYVEVSKSQSVDENGSVKELNYIEAEENLLSDEECTTIGWFNFNSYYWTGNQSTEWAEVENWARRPDGNGKFAEAPSKDSSTLEVYILQTALNSLIENDELISINLLENPEGKTVELNKGAEIQTIKNAGQIATQESVNVTTFENTGTIFVNAGILTIENYVPTSDKINIKEAATLKITKAEETTISDLTFEKTDSSTEDFASLLGNISVTSATYSEADIQTNGTIKLPSTESTTNEIGNLLIGSGNLTIETLHAANLTNDGTLSTKTVTVTQNITNNHEITSDTVLAIGDLTNNGKLNATTSVEANNIVNAGEITTLTLIANAELSNAENATITATNGSITVGANLTNDGTLSTKTVTVTQNITNAGEITSDTVLATGDLTNNGNLNAATSVEANNIVNAGEITSDTVLATGDLTNDGILNAATSVEATNIVNAGEITTLTLIANGELTNAENATITATNGSVTVGTNLTNDGTLSTKTITVTENITNNGNLNATSSVAANNIVNSGEITTPTVKANAELTNAENATITATNGSITVGTNLTNDGTLSTKTVTVTQNITNTGEITSDTVLATGDLTNNGNLNAATSVEANNIVNAGEITTLTLIANAELSNAENATITATNGSITVGTNLTNEGILSTKTVTVTQNITNAGEITSDTVLANNDLENNGNLNATTSVEATNITNSGEITTPTVKANAELSNAENATIIATNGSVTVGTNLTNVGTLSTKTIIVTQNITNFGSMNVATTNVGGNLIDNGTWAESGIINFVGMNDQNFDSNPITTYALINVEKLSGILTLANDLNAKDFVLKGGDLFINKILTTQRDVILLGKKYSVKDSVTNVDLFDYKGEVEFEILDATLLGTKVQLADDASIFVGKNFYANGIDISGGKIFIQKPINFAPFAQSFNGEISNNKAICSCVDCETEPNQTHAKIMAVGCVDKGENSGWDFDDATILKAQTVRDDVIKVFVNQPLAKISDENLSEFKFLIDDELNGSFQGIYSDVDCTQVFEDEIGTFDQTENSYYFFLKATSKWNTDASGSFAGNTLSTASDNLHYNSIPVIDIPRYTQEKGVIVKNKWGKPFANLSSRFFNGSSFVNVSDNCGPVLVEVKTGQEVHNLYDEAIGQSSQPSYDAHNFIEFEYSEPIIFKGNAYSSLDENIFVTSEFGQTDNSDGTLKINGLASFQKGKLITQSKDSTIADNQVNAFYRKDEYSFRFSVAGLTKGTIEYNSNEYKNWIGYIEEAEIPSGTVTLEFDSEGKNPFIQDLQLNHQEEWTSAPKLVVDSSFVGDFGSWDLSSPNFAFHVSEDKQIDWYEFVGNGDGFIKNIEFHLFDNDLENNTSVYDGAYWQTREGWLNQAGTLKIPESYAADIFGGSRPFITDEQNRTAGGIRLSSVYNTFENFEYSYGQSSPKSFVSFDTNVSAALFQSSSHDQTRISNGADGLYFALGITEIGLPLKTTFSVSYKSTDTLVVTDLAGNKLKDVAKISSYDVTPPAFTISVTPHNSDEIYMLFSEQINFADFEVKLSDNSSKTYNLVESISNVFEFGRIVDGHWQTIQDLKVESIKERKVFDAHTEIVLKLNQKLKFEQIQQIYIRVAKGLDNTVDVVTGSHNANVTLIQDDKGNYMMQYMAHPISDFAVDVLNLNYAYNSDIVNPSASENLDTTKEQKSRVVHDWSRTQANFGTLLLNHDITFNGTMLAESIADTQMIFSSSPEKESVASFYNEWTKKDSRIWLAEIPGFESLKFDSWSKENNSSVQFVPSEKQNDSITFDILKEQIPDVTSLSFLFALKDANSEYLTVNHYPAYNYSTKMYDLGQKFPLFALRLDNKEDIKSFDLWSLKLDSISLQRGGVTILNNVINPLLGDKAILKLDLAQKARVNILVMTLDGNIVKYLNRGSLDSGEYQFTWDGTNNSGKPVARGMYFIRVFGSGIDETRKVLIVK